MDSTQATMEAECIASHSLEGAFAEWCPAYWDQFLCWPPAENGSTMELPCPVGRMSQSSKKAFRVCGSDGNWAGEPQSVLINATGYSNYSACLTSNLWAMMLELGDEDEENVRILIAKWTRHLEFLGYSISSVLLVVSLVIFFKFRSLRNARTRLHINLLSALLLHSILRLILYSDLAITFSETYVETAEGIHSTPWLCETFYGVLEFSKMAIFSCMLMEGIYLRSLISVQVFRVAKLAKLYLLLGWLIPVPLTLMWVFCMLLKSENSTCWWGYHLDSCYWILQAPRLFVIVVNLLLLIMVVRVLVTKLKTSRTPELHQVRKATKAALVLLPLLGVPNLMIVVGAPSLNQSWVEFALWAFIAHLIVSFQGFVVAILFCLTNKEVKTIVCKKFQDFLTGEGVQNRSNGSVMYRVCRMPFSFHDQTSHDQGEVVMVKTSTANSTLL